MTSNKSKGIISWPEDERPRERLLLRGAYSLTDAELLAILLRVGVTGKSAVELGREIIQHFGSLQQMMVAPIPAWEGIKGLGDAKIAQLQAALELGRRAALPEKREHVSIKKTSQAAEYFKARLHGLPEEHFRVIYLSRRGHILEDALIAVGSVDTVSPVLRTVVAKALRHNASALVAAHNHPSGAASPSRADEDLTRNLIAACHPIGILVLDHLIISDTEAFSFADMGLLQKLSLETLFPQPMN